MIHPTYVPDPELDLVLERVVDVPPELVWEAWTVTECSMDLRPGGVFRSVMRSPEGEEFPNEGCFLEIVPGRRLVWTDTLGPGYRPADEPFFTAVISIEPEGDGTRYKAIAIHGSAETRTRHEEMGFHDGWSTVLDQLVEHMRSVED